MPWIAHLSYHANICMKRINKTRKKEQKKENKRKQRIRWIDANAELYGDRKRGIYMKILRILSVTRLYADANAPSSAPLLAFASPLFAWKPPLAGADQPPQPRRGRQSACDRSRTTCRRPDRDGQEFKQSCGRRRVEARAAGLHARLTPGTSEVSSISFSSICPLVFDLLQGGYFMVWAMGPGPPRHHCRRSYVWRAGLTTLFATSMFVFSHERPPSACDDSPNCMHEGEDR